MSFKEKGFYVEIGSNDPNLFPSHTTRFYLRGWTGINVEPQSEVFRGLAKAREKDINLNICLGATRGQMDFFELKGRTDASSLNLDVVTRSSKTKGTKIIPKRIEITPLAEVLMGNNWWKYRPRVLIIETVHHNYLKIVEYLKK